MARTRIDYGIDLGTTNSAISRMDRGEFRIIKSDFGQKDTTPSCVSFNKKQVLTVGDKVLNVMKQDALKLLKNPEAVGNDTYIEFKRTMGTEKMYDSHHMGRSYSSEELSAEVLKKLKSYVRDEEVHAAVVTVPAKFRQNQLDATLRAAELAGFEYCELLQEPIAASMAYGISADQIEGYWIVFDFGGGTFDAALMRVDEGIMKVLDTEGDNRLGGKNLDYAVVDKLLVPHLQARFSIESNLSNAERKRNLRDALKPMAEEIRIALSSKNVSEIYFEDLIEEDDEGNEVELDIKLDLPAFEQAVLPIYQKAVDLTLKTLERNNLTGQDLETIVLVGGPTYSQSLRRLLREQITENVTVTIDPMTAVANGAALFASTKELPMVFQRRDKAKIQLSLKYPETTVENEEPLAVKVERAATTGDVPQPVFAEISREDGGWNSGRVEIKDDADILHLSIAEGTSNGFSIALFDTEGNLYPCEPADFTIIHGLKAATATLPYELGLAIVDNSRKLEIFHTIRGLEKNQSLPAKGKGTFRSQSALRPGRNEDIIKIPIYEGDYGANGTRAILHEFAGQVVISGDDLPGFLPEGSEVEITISVNDSRGIRLSAFFPHLDEVVDIEVAEHKQRAPDVEELKVEIEKARNALSMLEDGSSSVDEGVKRHIDQQLTGLNEAIANDTEVDNRIEVHENIRAAWKQLDALKEQSAWPRVESQLREALDSLTTANDRYGDAQTSTFVTELTKKANVAASDKNTKLANDLIQEIASVEHTLNRKDPGFWVQMIQSINACFEMQQWKDKGAARKLLDEAKALSMSNPSPEVLEQATNRLIQLMVNPAIIEEASKQAVDGSKLTTLGD